MAADMLQARIKYSIDLHPYKATIWPPFVGLQLDCLGILQF